MPSRHLPKGRRTPTAGRHAEARGKPATNHDVSHLTQPAVFSKDAHGLNPLVGVTSSKALYLALGTAIGACATIMLAPPPFVESPYTFGVAVAVRTATLIYLAISDHGAHSYVFMLAANTIPLIALPSVKSDHRVRYRARPHRRDRARRSLRKRGGRRDLPKPARARHQ
jgi:hypothetical protein